IVDDSATFKPVPARLPGAATASSVLPSTISLKWASTIAEIRTGQGKPQTFDFLGFTFICGRSRRGAFLLRRHTRRDRMRAALQEVKTQLRNRRSDSIAEQGRWLRSVVTGYFAYHAVPTNAQAIGAYRHHVLDLWRRSLRRRSQKDRTTWARMNRLAVEWLPPPHVLHPWPEDRLFVKTRGRSRMP
ncbi:hypothetical protein ACG0Z3_22120, partial [Roseateles sp. LKC17W]